ncbi:MAG: gliding motility protein GldL [Bacteroidetes bacterium]|nr:gliding motility protein GldL [Bacteroidota bacterium]
MENINNTTEKKFDFINFFYGLGAAIILVAAMFKFLGWNLGDVLFIIGLTTEAIIFLISAFDWKYNKKEYEWDKVFPQLNKNEIPISIDVELLEGTQEQQIRKIIESLTTLHSSVVSLNTATRKLNESIAKIDKNFDVISETTSLYEKELNTLKDKIARANYSLRDFDNFAVKD